MIAGGREGRPLRAELGLRMHALTCCRDIAAGACTGFGPGQRAGQTRGGGIGRKLQSAD